MNKVTLGGKDGFWARVRAALGSGGQSATRLDGLSPLPNPNRKVRAAQQIEDDLRRAWTEAGSRKVSLCVLAMDMDNFADYFSAYGRGALDQSLATLEAAIATLVPRQDFACRRNGRSGFVLVLPDMPVLMARELAARIAAAVRHEGLPHRESHAGHVTLSMGLCVVNPQGSFDRAVLTGAVQAVKKAQRRGIGRLEIVDHRVLTQKAQKAA
jgi:diguanylate cyclase (GGDEF)-like protein